MAKRKKEDIDESFRLFVGRPAKIESVEQFEELVNAYVEKMQSESKPITITGLCLFMGFESRQSFYDMEKVPKFSYIVKKARLLVENQYEQNLSSNSPTGAIFALKNMGWNDTQKLEHTGEMQITWHETKTTQPHDPELQTNDSP